MTFSLGTPEAIVTFGPRLLRVVPAMMIAALGAPVETTAQPDWPIDRTAHAMVWHAGLRKIIMIGGVEATRDSAMWAWDGRTWAPIGTGGPVNLAHFAFGYDPRRDRLVVQGGFDAVFRTATPRTNGNTWEWDRRGWRLVSTGGPGVRNHHAMVYDPVRRQMVLFGGSDTTGTMLADTWIWNGATWRSLDVKGPSPRSTHRMVFDSARGVVLMFGGFGQNGLLRDTWEWTGRAWRMVADSGPSARFATRMAYDPGRDRVVLFGGRTNSGNVGDTWEWDGRRWSELAASGPSVRNVHEMAFDPVGRRVVLFGGFEAPGRFDDMWGFDGRWVEIPRPGAVPANGRMLAAGPHRVGYRVIGHRDPTRPAEPSRDFRGNPTGDARGTPMQISVWYPAGSDGDRMRVADYHAIGSKRSSLEGVTAADIAAVPGSLRATAAIQLKVAITPQTADSIAALRTRATRDAAPATGRFPLILGGLEGPGNASGIAEYLASYGYVVVTAPSLPKTATLQATNPAVALETQTRNLEVVSAVARALPFVDTTRTAVIGVNFDGLAALLYQMRNMTADAVITLDGWESKLTAGSLRASPSYDPSRVRVPYLAFSQDNPPGPALAFSDSVFTDLKYAARYAYVVHDMEHPQLLSDQTIYPQLNAGRRLGYDFVWRTVRSFLDVTFRGDSSARRFIGTPARENGYPGWLVEMERRAAPLNAIPTADEVESIAMSGKVEELRSIFRQAKAEDSAVRMFTESALNLFAFRFGQRGETATAVGFRELAVEAFPRSTAAANNLGNAYRDAGDKPKAIELFERALSLIDADPDLAPADKPPSRANITRKIADLRGS